MRTKELRAKRAKLITDAQALIDKEGATPEEITRFDAMMAEADTLKAQIDGLERAFQLQAELAEQTRETADRQGISADQAEDNRQAERRLLVAWLANGVAGLEGDDAKKVRARLSAVEGVRNAAGTGSGPAGGYTIAPDFMRELLVAMKAQGGMREAARVISTSTGVELPWPVTDDTAAVATIVGENSQLPDGEDMTFGSRTLKSFTYSTLPIRISLQLLQDTAFDFDALIRDACAGRFQRGTNAHFTKGNGTTQPEGLILGAPVGRTGAAGQTTSVTWDDLTELEHSVDPAYRIGARYMFHDSVLKTLKKLKDGQGRPLWSPGVAVGAPDTINGYGYSINQDMPVMAPGAKSIAFGNFKNYVVRDVLNLQMVRLGERYADSMQVGFLGFLRTDGRLVSAGEPVKTYQNPPS
ncbi:phage major capsid protein [Roseomonas sp. USHLN139]|uniref:phage major capsid protein n=1 Tax=Roseomonas sp. USHLN139 TaxID=3081298 RepID=UPI003B02018B